MASTGGALPKEENKRKVKVYQLSAQTGEWMDKGTGRIHVVEKKSDDDDDDDDDAADLDMLELKVVAEPSKDDGAEKANSTLLNHVVKANNGSYQQQQGTLIVWEDYEGYKTESYALSFLIKEGCDQVWNVIKSYQQRRQKEEAENGDSTFDWSLSLETLDAFLSRLTERLSLGNSWFKAHLLEQLQEHQIISRLGSIFDQSPKVSAESLAQIFLVMLQVSDEPPLEAFVSDDAMRIVCRIFDATLEIDSLGALHDLEEAELLLENICPLNNPSVRTALRQNSRCQILRDVILARASPETVGFLAQANSIWPLEYYNYLRVFDYVFLHNDGEYLRQLVNISKSDAGSQTLPMLAEYVRKLCHLPESNRVRCYNILIDVGAFDAIEDYLSDPDMARRTQALGVLCQVAENSLTAVRKECLRLQISSSDGEHQRRSLLDILIEKLHSETDFALAGQISDMIRKLLDSSPSEETSSAGFGCSDQEAPNYADQQAEADFESFLTMFYHYYINRLMRPLQNVATLQPEKGRIELSPSKAGLYCQLCDLLCFLIKTHGYRAKFSIMDRSSPGQPTLFSLITLLCSCNAPILQLSALKVIRTAVGINEKFWEDLLVNSKTLAAVVAMFHGVKHRLNVLNAACLELFDYILKTPRKRLLKYMVEECLDELDDVFYVSVFRDMRRLYQSWLDSPSLGLSIPRNSQLATPQNSGVDHSTFHVQVAGSSPFWSCGSKRSFDESQLSDEGGSTAVEPIASAVLAVPKSPSTGSSPSSFTSASSSLDLSPLKNRVLSDEEEDLDVGIFRSKPRSPKSPSLEALAMKSVATRHLSVDRCAGLVKRPGLSFNLKSSESPPKDKSSSASNLSTDSSNEVSDEGSKRLFGMNKRVKMQ